MSSSNSLTGEFQDVIPLLSIGGGGSGLSHAVMIFGQSERISNHYSAIRIDDTPVNGDYSYDILMPGDSRIRFLAATDTPNGSTSFSEYLDRGNNLEFANGIYTFQSRSGMVAKFQAQGPSAEFRVTEIEPTNGNTVTYTYNGDNLSSVKNEAGFMLKYEYGGTPTVTGINYGTEYCSPSASTCSVASHWPEASGAVTGSSFDDAEDRTYSLSVGSNTIQLNSPMSGVSTVANYGNDGMMDSLSKRGRVTTFDVTYNDKGTPSDDSDDERTVLATRSNGGGSVTTISRVKGSLILSQNDVLGQTTSYTYTANNRIDTITYPRGDTTEYTYDGRGNVTEMRHTPASGSSLADLVTTAGFPTSCTTSNFKYCNKPIWTEDTAGNRTDYTYHAPTGSVKTITHPSDGTNGRPVTSYNYVSLQANLKGSGNSTVQGAPIWKIQSVTRFLGTPQEVTATYSYDANKNLLPSSMTVSGNGVSSNTVNFTYDNYGNQTSTDGPIPGTADKSAAFFDKLQRTTGVISGDPDGSGPRPRRAIRTFYNDLGQKLKDEIGTTTGLSQSSLNSMSVLQIRNNTYSGNAKSLLESVTLEAGGSFFSQVDYSYDSQNRVECTALRMNPSALGSSFASACTPTVGPFGPDRITKRQYDVASRVLSTTRAFGTSAAATETASYFNYGPVQYLNDGEGNRTTYTYDGYSRPKRIYYPDSNGNGQTGADHVRYDYDNSGRLYRTRLRDGRLITRTLDNLGQTTATDIGGLPAEDLTMSYDIAGRPTGLSKNGSAFTFAFDAFGRKESESSADGTISYDYDAYGRRTKTTYPGTDNFNITYSYYEAGELKDIKENNSMLIASYTYDSQGRRKTVTRGSSNNVTTYNYDMISRLTSLENDLSGTSKDQTLTFTYIPSGQLNTEVNSNPIYDATLTTYDQDFVMNGLNQILSENGVMYGYDTKGNMTSANGRSFSYDWANRLISANIGSGNASLTYDAASRLRTLTKGSDSSRFGYDGESMISEHDHNTGALKTRYVHGPSADEPLIRYTYSGSSVTKEWYVTDRLGSVTGLANASGVSTAVNHYDPYGQPQAGNEGRFQYTGQVWLEEVGLYYYKARFYDPITKRFINPDPIGYGDGMNMYAYVGGDPLNATDPSGMTTCLTYTRYVQVAIPDGVEARPTNSWTVCDRDSGSPDYVPGYNNPGGGGNSGAGDSSQGNQNTEGDDNNFVEDLLEELGPCDEFAVWLGNEFRIAGQTYQEWSGYSAGASLAIATYAPIFPGIAPAAGLTASFSTFTGTVGTFYDLYGAYAQTIGTNDTDYMTDAIVDYANGAAIDRFTPDEISAALSGEGALNGGSSDVALASCPAN